MRGSPLMAVGLALTLSTGLALSGCQQTTQSFKDATTSAATTAA